MSTATLDRVIESATNAPAPVVDVTVEVLITAKEHGAESLVAAALTRLIRGILVGISHNESCLPEVVSAPTDLKALLVFLEIPEVIEALSKLDPLAKASIRGVFRKAELYEAEGGCVSGEEAGKLMNRQRQSIDAAWRRGDVIALPSGKDGRVYPVWQFIDGRYLPGLKEIQEIFQEESPFVVCSFLLSGNALLDGKTPLSLLRLEQVKEVLQAAKAFGDHGG